MTNHLISSASGEQQPRKHCRHYGYAAGFCARLHCARCGAATLAALRKRIVKAASRHAKIYFVTIYFDHRFFPDLNDLPLFEFATQAEKVFRQHLNKILRALRDKARRVGEKFEYVAVLAFGKPNHRVHKRTHSHVLTTWLPDIVPHEKSMRTERLDSPFLSEKCKKLGLVAWIELARSKPAVARYSAENLRPALGVESLKGLRLYRFSEGFE